MKEWLFTFGFSHQYPNHFIRIKGTFSEARKIMFSRFGDKWAFQYPSSEEENLKKYNIKELNYE